MYGNVMKIGEILCVMNLSHTVGSFKHKMMRVIIIIAKTCILLHPVMCAVHSYITAELFDNFSIYLFFPD